MSDSAGDTKTAAACAVEEPLEPAVLRKVTLRLIPFLFLLYVVNILDRANIGIAKLHMLTDLDMSEKACGFGAGVFSSGCQLFEVSRKLILRLRRPPS